jgi:hypothetical protein
VYFSKRSESTNWLRAQGSACEAILDLQSQKVRNHDLVLKITDRCGRRHFVRNGIVIDTRQSWH